MKQTLILLGLTAYTMAAPLKQRLAQGSNGGNGGSGAGLDCTCELPGTPGSGFPDLGQGEFGSFGNGAIVSQGAEVVTVPDTQWASYCESDCCACNVGVHESEAAATRNRHFEITGAITVAETVEYIESGEAEEQSAGHSQKATACITTNDDSSGEAPEDCVCVCIGEESEGGNGAAPK